MFNNTLNSFSCHSHIRLRQGVTMPFAGIVLQKYAILMKKKVNEDKKCTLLVIVCILKLLVISCKIFIYNLLGLKSYPVFVVKNIVVLARRVFFLDER